MYKTQLHPDTCAICARLVANRYAQYKITARHIDSYAQDDLTAKPIGSREHAPESIDKVTNYNK